MRTTRNSKNTLQRSNTIKTCTLATMLVDLKKKGIKVSDGGAHSLNTNLLAEGKCKLVCCK